MFAGIIAADLWLYWCRCALGGKFGHKAQTQIATALAMGGGGVFGPLATLFAIVVPFLVLPVALYVYPDYRFAKMMSREPD